VATVPVQRTYWRGTSVAPCVRRIRFSCAVLGAGLLMLLAWAPSYADPLGPRSSSALKLIEATAEALGGKDRILAVKTVRIVGYGQSAYQDGGGNVDPSPYAPRKWNNISQDRVSDYANNRMRLRGRSAPNFVFVFERSMRGTRFEVGLDGDVAFSVAADGRATRSHAASVRVRRIEMLANPIGSFEQRLTRRRHWASPDVSMACKRSI
jgi:hypothetical protein